MFNLLKNMMFLADVNQTTIPKEVRTAVCSTFICLMAIAAIALIVVVMMQKGTQDNISAISGGSNNDTFFGKNKGRSREGKLKIATIVIGILLVILSIVYIVVLNIGV